jgi:hypothetical protein
MKKDTTKKRKISSNKSVADLEKHFDDRLKELKEEAGMMYKPQINDIKQQLDTLESRDRLQYEAAKKIMVDLTTILGARTETVEKIVVDVKKELEEADRDRKEGIDELIQSFNNLNSKIDVHISEQANDFKQVGAQLNDIANHGTALARNIDDKLNHIKVNGGVYAIGDAIQHIYLKQHETGLKVDDVMALVEPMQARKRWFTATGELIRKNGMLHFFLTTKIGVIMATMGIILLANTIAVDVFHTSFDLVSIFKWILSLFKGS